MTTTFQSGIYIGQGSAVTGFYTFDTSLVDTTGGPEIDDFDSRTLGNQGLTFEIFVTNGAITRSSASNRNLAGTFHHIVEWFDRADEDRFRFDAARSIASDDSARIFLRDFSPTPPDAVAVGTGNLTGTPITTAPNVSLFDTVVGQSFYVARDNAGSLEGVVNFTLTSITPVPEPSTGLLLITGLLGLAFRQRRSLSG